MNRDFPEGAVEDALISVGIEILTMDGDEIIALCPGHEDRTGKQDHNPSWSINSRSGVHYCFSCGFKGNLFTLVRRIKGVEAADNLYAPFKKYGRLVTPDDDWSVDATVPSPESEVRTVNFKPDSWLDEFVSPPEWALAARKISIEGAEEYEVLWDADNDRWILPLREPKTRRLLGYQIKAEGGRYFRNRPRDMAKSLTFFGWPLFEKRRPKKLVVVESPLDAVLLSDYGIQSVAVCGSRLSDEQILLLHEVEARVLFWLDFDTAGELETARLRKEFFDTGLRAEFVRSEDFPTWAEGRWKDPGDLPDEAIEDVLAVAGF